jgi:hypothetical protein
MASAPCLRADGFGFVGHADVAGGAVDVGVYGHAGDAHLAQRPDDAHGDLAAVGNQYLAEHAGKLYQQADGAAAAALAAAPPIVPGDRCGRALSAIPGDRQNAVGIRTGE